MRTSIIVTLDRLPSGHCTASVQCGAKESVLLTTGNCEGSNYLLSERITDCVSDHIDDWFGDDD